MTLTVLTIYDKGPRGGGTRVQVDRSIQALRMGGFTVQRLRLGRRAGESDDEDSFPLTFWPHQGLALRSRFLEKVANFKPDLVHVHGSAASLSGVLLKALARHRPVVVTLHDVGLFCMTGLRIFGGSSGDVCVRRAGVACWKSGCWRPPGLFGPAAAVASLSAKVAQRRAWLSQTRVVVPSRYLADLARLHGIADDRTTVVPNICSASQVPPLSPDARPHVLFVGTLSRDKGADLALEALAKLPGESWSATFAGDGPDRTALEMRARKMGLRHVVFAGWREGDDLTRLREQSTVGIFPSRVVESFGLSGLESLAAGRPVVGVARGGVSEWLRDDETGLAIPLPQPEILAGRLTELLFDGERVRRLGEQGRRLVAGHFSPEAHLRLMSSVYSDAVAFRRPERVNA